MSSELQTKCADCGRRFGEMDDEPVECPECELLTCPDCSCGCGGEEKAEAEVDK